MEWPPIGLCWGTINQASLVETIEAAARHGFPTITATPGIYDEALAAGFGAAALRRRLSDAGVRVRVIEGISTGFPGQPTAPIPYRGRSLKRYDAAECIAAAEALGAPIVSVTHYGGEPTPLPVIAEAVGEACRLAAARGVEVTIEFIPDSAIPDIAAARTIVETSGAGNCSIMVDTWHLARSGGTAADIRALPPGIVGTFQLADRIAPAPGAAYVPLSGRSLPGEGELPLAGMVAAALANNPAITVELEVFSEELAAMTADAAAARSAGAVRAWRSGLT